MDKNKSFKHFEPISSARQQKSTPIEPCSLSNFLLCLNGNFNRYMGDAIS